MLSAMTRRTHGSPSASTAIRVGTLALAGVLGLTGCVSGNGGKASPSAKPPSSPAGSQGATPAPGKPIQTQWSSIGGPVRVDLLSLDRISNDVLVLRLRIVNTGSTGTNITDGFTPSNGGNIGSFGGMALVDGTNLKAYYPWQRKSDSAFVESGFPDFGSLDAKEQVNASILYPAPPVNVTKMNVFAPRVTFSDVPVNMTGQRQAGDPAFVRSAAEAPVIRPLHSTKDDLSGDKSEDDSGDKVAIRLSADVLFKLNKANLSDKANAILKQVATRIDQSKAPAISVDGYTDSSGNNAINNPLSDKRAKSVRDALQKLVTRQGVTYTVAGHGSADPVASNGSAEGRKKNRRVTVSFGK
jgi:outer membrane protein OmpA-like peptidoglycan-associated protein